ncbi:Hsp33 family molecular chaperone HslO, partial [Staphylococcus aureus]
EAALRGAPQATLLEMFGEGAYLAITFDPGEGMQRYQGVVALEGATIADALQGYFRDSQQIEVLIQLTVAHHGQWRAAGILLERMPQA